MRFIPGVASTVSSRHTRTCTCVVPPLQRRKTKGKGDLGCHLIHRLDQRCDSLLWRSSRKCKWSVISAEGLCLLPLSESLGRTICCSVFLSNWTFITPLAYLYTSLKVVYKSPSVSYLWCVSCPVWAQSPTVDFLPCIGSKMIRRESVKLPVSLWQTPDSKEMLPKQRWISARPTLRRPKATRCDRDSLVNWRPFCQRSSKFLPLCFLLHLKENGHFWTFGLLLASMRRCCLDPSELPTMGLLWRLKLRRPKQILVPIFLSEQTISLAGRLELRGWCLLLNLPTIDNFWAIKSSNWIPRSNTRLEPQCHVELKRKITAYFLNRQLTWRCCCHSVWKGNGKIPSSHHPYPTLCCGPKARYATSFCFVLNSIKRQR